MSLLSRLRAALALPAVASGDVRYLSPYDDVNHLWPIVAPDWLPEYGVTRAAAMAVPAVKRARGLVCHGVARNRLAAFRDDDQLAVQPLWIDRTDGPVSPYHRMLWTVDDLFFYGWSAWAVQRSTGGAVIAADRIPWDKWRTDELGRVLYTDQSGSEIVADASSVILIPGHDEGLLAAPNVIRHAADLLNAASTAAANPAAYLDLHQTNDYPITEAERIRIIDGWRAARRGENGGVAFSSAGIEVRELGTFSEHLLVEGRNAAALDVARAAGLPGQLLDATTATASLTYESADAADEQRLDTLAAYMLPISARLGMDDVVPRGVSVRFLGMNAATTEGAPDDNSGSSRPAVTAPAPAGGADNG